MKTFYLFILVLSVNLTVDAQEMHYEIAKPYNESMDSITIPSQIRASLRKLVSDAEEVSWGPLFCIKCPKEGSYSYFQAEFYQGDEEGEVTFNEKAQPVAFSES